MYQQNVDLSLAHSARDPWIERAIPAGLVLMAVFLFMLCTRQGIGILPDSTRYMSMAARPWDAPLYPALLQLASLTGIDLVQSAWAVGLAVTIVNTALIWRILRESTGLRSYAAMGTALIAIAPQTVTLNALAMSEPLFLTMILATITAMMAYWRTGEGRWLLAAGIAVGLASLVRFTGPPLGAAIALYLLIDPRFTLARRIGQIALVAAPSALLFLGWTILSELVVGRSIGRPLRLYGNMTGDDWIKSFNALQAWLVPDEVPGAIRTVLFLLAFAAAVVLLVRHGRRALDQAAEGQVDARMLVVPLGLFFFTYLGFMIVATSIEANLHLNSRYAYPIYCTSIIAMTIVLAHARGSLGRPRWLHGSLVGLGCFMLVIHGLRTADRTHQAYEQGVGYASRDWTASPTLAAVRQLPQDAILYSNGPDAIGYVLRRRARNMPAHTLLRTGHEDPRYPYAIQLDSAHAALRRRPTYLVFLNGIHWRFYMASEAELVRSLDLVLVRRLSDGSIYTGRTIRPATTSGERENDD
ncbi:MAG: glycosyltransferase family 39 protein [Sphingobium sp.]